ncbi:hypothetical protein FSARC_7999 [Fusarium sarcochroum]|uniref:Uncharacterized protein n=1 Tax=Fusarium sarcochroum TaxID=1208366 RepID=A0A8H4TTZ2_9HYPO|nr:hypothetical protein FSARC_7999 [Fusarium sarcochroum]
MRWTPHMEEHLQHLQDEPETPGDEVLVTIVKVSRIMDDLLLAVPPAHLASVEGQSRTPPILYVKSLVTKLDVTKQQLSQELLGDKIVQSYLHNAYMMVNSIPVMNSSCLNIKSGLSDFGKTDCIYACVDVIKQGLDNWFSFAAEDVWAMPLAPMLQFGRCTHILYRIYMTEDPAWDRFDLRKAIDLIQVLERGAEVMETVPRTVSLHSDGDDFFARTSRTLSHAATLWKRAFAESGVGDNYDCGIQGSTGSGAGDFTFDGLMSMDTFDDAWLSEIFTSWDSHQE